MCGVCVCQCVCVCVCEPGWPSLCASLSACVSESVTLCVSVFGCVSVSLSGCVSVSDSLCVCVYEPVCEWVCECVCLCVGMWVSDAWPMILCLGSDSHPFPSLFVRLTEMVLAGTLPPLPGGVKNRTSSLFFIISSTKIVQSFTKDLSLRLPEMDPEYIWPPPKKRGKGGFLKIVLRHISSFIKC